MPDGSERQLDVVVAADDGEPPSESRILAIGEAKTGERVSISHLRRLEESRRVMGERAEGARLLLFGTSFGRDVIAAAKGRQEVELIGLDRLYEGN
jgi:hypothetical protein